MHHTHIKILQFSEYKVGNCKLYESGAAMDAQIKAIIDRLIGQQVQNLRHSRSVTVAELAQQVGVSTKHMEDLEKGDAIFPAALMIDLAKALKVEEKTLFDLVYESVERNDQNVVDLNLYNKRKRAIEVISSIEDMDNLAAILNIAQGLRHYEILSRDD